MTAYCFIHPLGPVSPRSHRLFGDPGSFGEAAMPPAPSVFAGALRSALVGRKPALLAACEQRDLPGAISGFRLTQASLARQAGGRIEAIFPMPADLVVIDGVAHRIEPAQPPAGLHVPHDLPLLPILKASRGKPQTGAWLTECGFGRYLADELPKDGEFVFRDVLWKNDSRPGIALDGERRTAADGALFTADHIALSEGVGFLCGYDGAGEDAEGGVLRLAGDGRGAEWRRIDWTPPAAPLDAIAGSRRFRLILATSGLFGNGWLPPGVDPQTRRLEQPGFSARLACAAVPRAELVSGWDLMENRPKPALAAVPAGSVWWFDEFDGEAGKLADWAAAGLWDDNDCIAASRRAEGWNRAWLGAWN